MTIWEDIAAERRDLADDLEALTDTQWETDSLCEGWTVKATAAHVTTPFHLSMAKFAWKILTSGGFNGASRKIAISEAAERSTADIIAELRDNAENQFTPPRLGPEAPLGDIVIHGQDIRRPLGIVREFPQDRLATVLGFLTSTQNKFVLPSKGIDGLSFEASDMDWSAGAGPTVSGKGEALMMAIGGRSAALDELEGEGLEAFRFRFE